MTKPDQPKTTVEAVATRAYVFSPDERRMVTSWDDEPLVALRLFISSHSNGQVMAECVMAVGFLKDGSVGKQERSAKGWWRLSEAPEWVQDLAADMPTPKVTLVPPKGKQP